MESFSPNSNIESFSSTISIQNKPSSKKCLFPIEHNSLPEKEFYKKNSIYNLLPLRRTKSLELPISTKKDKNSKRSLQIIENNIINSPIKRKIATCEFSMENDFSYSTNFNNNGTIQSAPSTPITTHFFIPGSTTNQEDDNASLLPIIKKKDSCKYISLHTVASLLKKENYINVEFIIIDCRFKYEYDGGHIEKSINLTNIEEIENYFLKNPFSKKNFVIIFYCEYSSKRGPKLCQYLRERDRKIHINDYPNLFYPEIYVMEGGYKLFFEFYPNLCNPSSYIRMRDKSFSNSQQKEISKYKKFPKSYSTGNIKN